MNGGPQSGRDNLGTSFAIAGFPEAGISNSRYCSGLDKRDNWVGFKKRRVTMKAIRLTISIIMALAWFSGTNHCSLVMAAVDQHECEGHSTLPAQETSSETSSDVPSDTPDGPCCVQFANAVWDPATSPVRLAVTPLTISLAHSYAPSPPSTGAEINVRFRGPPVPGAQSSQFSPPLFSRPPPFA